MIGNWVEERALKDLAGVSRYVNFYSIIHNVGPSLENTFPNDTLTFKTLYNMIKCLITLGNVFGESQTHNLCSQRTLNTELA